MQNDQNIIIYNTIDGKASVALYAKDGKIWLNQMQMAELIDTSKQTLESAELRVRSRKDLTLDYWRNNVNQLLEFQGHDVLIGNGSISNAQMEIIVDQVYDNFDTKRKHHEALMADEEDIKLLDEIVNEVKNRDKN